MSKRNRNNKIFLKIFVLFLTIDIVVSIPLYLFFSEWITIYDLLLGIPIDLMFTIVTFRFCKQGETRISLQTFESLRDRYGTDICEKENLLSVKLRGWGRLCLDDMVYEKMTGVLYAPMFIINRIQK